MRGVATRGRRAAALAAGLVVWVPSAALGSVRQGDVRVGVTVAAGCTVIRTAAGSASPVRALCGRGPEPEIVIERSPTGALLVTLRF